MENIASTMQYAPLNKEKKRSRIKPTVVTTLESVVCGIIGAVGGLVVSCKNPAFVTVKVTDVYGNAGRLVDSINSPELYSSLRSMDQGMQNLEYMAYGAIAGAALPLVYKGIKYLRNR